MNRILFYLCCLLCLIARTAKIQETSIQVYDGTIINSDRIQVIYIYKYNTIMAMISLKKKDLYKKCKTDELEYNSVQVEFSMQMEDLIAIFDFSNVYYINNQVIIDKYDFTKNSYPVNFIKNERLGVMKYGDYNLAFYTFEPFLFIPITLEYGKEVNKLRQGRNLYISNLVYGRFYLKPLDNLREFPKSDTLNFENLYSKTLIGEEFVGIEVYDFKNCDYNFYGSVK